MFPYLLFHSEFFYLEEYFLGLGPRMINNILVLRYYCIILGNIQNYIKPSSVQQHRTVELLRFRFWLSLLFVQLLAAARSVVCSSGQCSDFHRACHMKTISRGKEASITSEGS